VAEHSAGILLYRHRDGGIEVLLVHPGGPYWQRRDAGAWQIPKGGIDEGEDPLAAALREFEEELGTLPQGKTRPLGQIRQASGKWVDAFALEGDLDPDTIISATFDMEWPPRSGVIQSFPEIDRARWFALREAHAMMLASQRPLLDLLEEQLG
jgi:predicted NUDIX family NTP pyrophosphohydrolase